MTKKSGKKMGCLAKLVIWLVVILVVLGVFVQFGLDNTIQWSVNNLGPKVLGVDTSVQRVYLSPIQGRVTLEGLHVGNPEGFHTDGIFDLAKMDVDLSMKTLFSDPLVIRHVVVEGMEVTYEQGLLHSNVGTLIDNLSGEEKPDEEEKPEELEEEKGEGRKVVIEKFSLADSKVRVAMTGMMGLGVPIPLPGMELEGIGEKSGGATVKDVLLELLKDIGGVVTDTVVGVGGVVVDGAKAVGGVVADGAGAAVDAVSDSAKAVGGTVAGMLGFGGGDVEEEEPSAPEEAAAEVTEVAEEAVEEVTEAVEEAAEPSDESAAASDEVNEAVDAISDSAKAVGDAISDGASAVGDAVSDGAKAVSGALAGMLGFGGEKEEAAAPEEPAEAPAEAVEETVEEAAEAVEEAVESSEEPAEVSDEVNAVADAVSDSAKAVGDAVSDGAKAVSGALKGVFGFGSDKAEEPAEPAAE